MSAFHRRPGDPASIPFASSPDSLYEAFPEDLYVATSAAAAVMLVDEVILVDELAPILADALESQAPVVWWKEEDDVMRFDRGAKTITDCCELRFGCRSRDSQVTGQRRRTKQDRNYLKFVSPTKWEAIESSSHLSMGMQLYADTSCKLHPSKFVRNEESWELLKRKGFIKGSCFIELEKDGECIAIKCGGLPLAEVVIVGVLVQYTSNNCYCKW
nr:putative late blight resistance protein homolog R1B-14 [Ipomoea batatas]